MSSRSIDVFTGATRLTIKGLTNGQKRFWYNMTEIMNRSRTGITLLGVKKQFLATHTKKDRGTS